MKDWVSDSREALATDLVLVSPGLCCAYAMLCCLVGGGRLSLQGSQDGGGLQRTVYVTRYWLVSADPCRSLLMPLFVSGWSFIFLCSILFTNT